MEVSDVHIRKARKADIPAILDLVKELAVFERAGDQVTADLDMYRASFEAGHFSALVAQVSDVIAGTAIYYPTFSTWRGPMLHLEDFIVRADFRNRGIGGQLFERFLEEARESGAVMCKWQVLDWNRDAIRFYERYPVVFDGAWIDVKYYFDDRDGKDQ